MDKRILKHFYKPEKEKGNHDWFPFSFRNKMFQNPFKKIFEPDWRATLFFIHQVFPGFHPQVFLC